ncbi:MAG: aminomethyltransferase, partial [Pseudomonadota bacterium]
MGYVFETPYERAGVIAPGLPILPHGVERHPVPGGGSRAVRIDRGDEITVVDKEGLQNALLVFYKPDGISDASTIGARGGADGAGLQDALSADHTGARVIRALSASGFDIGQADAARVLGDGSRPGDSETFHASSDGLLIVCAPGGPMAPEAQDAPTEIILYIRRAAPSAAKASLTDPCGRVVERWVGASLSSF